MSETAPSSPGRRRLLFALPLGAAAAAGAGFLAMLADMRRGTFDPHEVGSPVLGKPVPRFALPGVGGVPGFSSTELQAQRRPVLVNFFASWCIPCVAEAQEIAALAARVPVWGIAYKDKPADVGGFLARTGSPYARVALDASGDTAIDWGVTGVPESFLIDPGGIISWHFDAGPLDAATVRSELLPRLG